MTDHAPETLQAAETAPRGSVHRIVGRRYHDTDKRRYGIIIEIKHGMPLMQLNSGRRFLIFPDVLARNWIECDESPTSNKSTTETAPPSCAPSNGSVAIARCQRYLVGHGPEFYNVTVRVMAIVDGYAMVRRKGCSPFVIKANLLRPQNNRTEP